MGRILSRLLGATGHAVEKPSDRLQSCRVLIVDNDHFVAGELAAILANSGCEVAMAPGMHSALEILHRVKPQIAFIDLRLEGGFTGLRLGELIRDTGGTGIVFITASAPLDIHYRLRGFGPMVTLFKPYEPAAIDLALRAVLNLRPRAWSTGASLQSKVTPENEAGL